MPKEYGNVSDPQRETWRPAGRAQAGLGPPGRLGSHEGFVGRLVSPVCLAGFLHGRRASNVPLGVGPCETEPCEPRTADDSAETFTVSRQPALAPSGRLMPTPLDAARRRRGSARSWR